jgi:nicotinamidase-related amidase
VILTGMETHICVLQTAFELKQQGFEGFVAEDAVCARDRNRNLNGLNRMRQAGISITHSESVLFEWLRDASHPQFKILSSLLK